MNETNPSCTVNILLISDNDVDIAIIRRRLEENMRMTTTVYDCTTLGDAVRHLNDAPEPPHIIILDLGLHGEALPREIFRKIRMAGADIPIIVVTGATDSEHDLVCKVMEAGAADHIVHGEFQRLGDALHFSLIRHGLILQAADTAAFELQDEKGKRNALVSAEHAKGTKQLREAAIKADDDMNKKNQVISWLTGGYSVQKSAK